METGRRRWDKLVRDGIPDKIKARGDTPLVRTLEEDEYRERLRDKAYEEAEEWFSARSRTDRIEELADLLQAIHDMAQLDDATIETVEHFRRAKEEVSGGFAGRVLLIETFDASKEA